MIDPSLILLFVPTMFLISITPGMCMTLAMTLGMTVGLRRTVWMMAGEVVGVALVAGLCGIGVASIMVQFPAFFTLFKWAGGAYLGWMGVQMWRSRGSLSLNLEHLDTRQAMSNRALAAQGFITAIANPKGWAFFMALLPPFLIADDALNLHLAAVLAVVVISELICMMIYAVGGKTLHRLLKLRGNVQVINRIAGSLMIGVGVWLATS